MHGKLMHGTAERRFAVETSKRMVKIRAKVGRL